MTTTIEIDAKHITRVEGHGNIVVRAEDGVILENQWQIPEVPRFFEGMVRERHFEDIQTIASRICGICSVTHSLAAIKAVEAAFGTEVSPQTEKLRRLTHYGEQIESHALHIGYLVAPDLLGQPSVVPLIASAPEAVKHVIKVHRVGNALMECLAGRKTHPVRLKPGGFTMLPSTADLRELAELLGGLGPSLEAIVELVVGVVDRLPQFDRETEYVALRRPPAYPFYDGEIGSTDTAELVPIWEFERVTNEYTVAQSTAKWARWHRDAYCVGALARYKLNQAFLQPEAQATASRLGLDPSCTNPYFNTVAQLVELVQVVQCSLQLIDELLTTGLDSEAAVSVEPREAEGCGCVEAPRGILFHRYAFDRQGICQRANMCIPTNQNHGNIQRDFEALVPTLLDRDSDAIRQQMELLVRAYDPCISCSTHYLDISFV
jgi:sulfhydrogenase subunit alpha